MSVRKTLGCSLLVVLPVWLWFSWPLPKHVLTDIPAGFNCTERYNFREMIPGDHLQLLYRLWLGRDMIEGHTPWFYDLYQFNTGRDEDRFEPDPNFFFFTVLFSLGSWAVNDAFGYNAAGFVSVWLSYFFVWLLVRRYVEDPWTAGLMALIGLVLPYRWIPFLGGSTTGPDMLFVPALCLGLDLAVRENRKGGAVLAGAALLLTGWSDTHVFFFSVLMTPAWCLVAAFGRRPFPWARLRDVLKTIRAFWPFAIFAGGVALTVYATHHNLKGARMAAGRSTHEVMLNAPEGSSFFEWVNVDREAQIYVGIFLVALIGAGWLVSVVRLWRERRENWRPFVVLTCLCLGLGLIGVLALGPRGPWDGAVFGWIRDTIKPYAMIRQPAKVFCLAPVCFAVAGALAMNSLTLGLRRRWAAAPATLAALVTLTLTVQYGYRLSPTLCRLVPEQGAYRAAAADAQASGVPARALIIPLWPGDSHYVSISQYFVSRYRLRMVNGYSPKAKTEYFNTIFKPFESVNQGGLSDSQAAELHRRNITHLLLHEDLFPEKVSPFPVGFTLKQFMNQPWLEFLGHDQQVWAFKILNAPKPHPEALPDWTTFFPTRRWEMERLRWEKAVMEEHPAAAGGGIVKMEGPDSCATTDPVGVVPASGLRWSIRVKGDGVLQTVFLEKDKELGRQRVVVRAADWVWVDFPMPALSEFAFVAFRFSCLEGRVDADLALLEAGRPLPSLQPGESWTLPAACFFHAGNTDTQRGSVNFRKERDINSVVLYGPKLPLERGRYRATIDFISPAPAGEALGACRIQCEERDRCAPQTLVAGRPVALEFEQPANLPVNLVVTFDRAADVEIRSLTLTRLGAGERW